MEGQVQLQALQGSSDPALVMRRVVDQALVLIAAADGAVIELIDGDELSYVCWAGTLATHVGTRLRIATSLSGQAVRTGKTLSCKDTTCDARVNADACRRVGAASMVCVPLRHGEQRIGALKVSAATPNAFTSQDVLTLARLAAFISLTVAASTELKRLITDVINPHQTGAANPTSNSVPAAGINRAGGEHRVGEFVANVLQPGMLAELTVRRRIERVLAEQSFRMLTQPIVDTDSGQLAGVEALARFPGSPAQPPDAWFAEAQTVGLGIPLQLAAVNRALALLDELPASAFLAINIGPEAIATTEFTKMLGGSNGQRVVLELTEHVQIDDYQQLRTALQGLREHGIRLAVDDAGAGFSSLAHIVNLAPDLIKLDRHFTRGIDLDPVRQALATALMSFANDTGAQLIAEGIQTADELTTIRQLGIPFAQGYFIGRPTPPHGIPATFPQLTRPQPARLTRQAS